MVAGMVALVALAVAIKHTSPPVCDLEAEGCVAAVGSLHSPKDDCRTCAAHMELCMVTPRIDDQMQVRVVLAGACVEQIANRATGCSACKTPEGKKMFKARVDAAKAERSVPAVPAVPVPAVPAPVSEVPVVPVVPDAPDVPVPDVAAVPDVPVLPVVPDMPDVPDVPDVPAPATAQPLETAATEKIDSAVCDLEAEGCVDVGTAQDCRTCAAHMNLCMDTPQLDEEKQVRVVLAGACVEQIASKAKGCSACKTPEGKKMFKARVDAAKALAEQSTATAQPPETAASTQPLETAASKKTNSTVCDLEAEGCVNAGSVKDCRTCAAHMELCMVTPHLDEKMQIQAVTAEDCVVQVADQAAGCNACKTPEGKQAFRARVGDVASGDEKTDRRLPIDVASSKKKNSTVCNFEATGCISVQTALPTAVEDCRTCAAHMELCMHTQSLDENLVVKVVTTDDCVVQVADQAGACSACKSEEGKAAFRTRLGDVATASAGAAASATRGGIATHEAVIAAGDAAEDVAAARASETVANATRAAKDIFDESATASRDAMDAKVEAAEASSAAAEAEAEASGPMGKIPPSPPPNAKVCDFQKSGCITIGAVQDCRACSGHINNCMITDHRDSGGKLLENGVEACAVEVAVRAEGCAKCGNKDSIMAYKRQVGQMPSPPQTPPLPPPPSPTPLLPPNPPSLPPSPPPQPPPLPPPHPPPKSNAEKATEEYTKLDRYWRALKQQAQEKQELASQVHRDRVAIMEELQGYDESVKALVAAKASEDMLNPANDWAEEARGKLRAAKIADEEAQVDAAEAKQSALRAFDARKKGKADADAAAELERQGITEADAASTRAKQIEDAAHGLKPQVLQYESADLQ